MRCAVLVLLPLLHGCFVGGARCSGDVESPPPALGTYEMWEPVDVDYTKLPPEAIVDATAILSEGRVVIEYTRNDGARFRATYASTVEYRH